MLSKLTTEQELFRDTAVRFIEDYCPISTVRAMMDEGAGMPPGYLHECAELGWFSLLIPEHPGSNDSESGLIDAAVIAGVRGAFVQPGPFIPMNVVAFSLGREHSSTRCKNVLSDLTSGNQIAAWVLGPNDRSMADHPDVRATVVSDGYTLHGTVAAVPYAQTAAWLLVESTLEDDAVGFLVESDRPGVRIEPLECFDLTTRMGAVHLDDVLVSGHDMVGTPSTGRSAREARLDIALVLTIAETIGAMDRLFSLTVEYARSRIAFGRPIGSFQALKHQMADMSLLLEMSKASWEAAANAVSQGSGSALASVAKAFVGDASTDISQGCFQVHGGIGYTWEHDLHLFLRRAAANRVLYGDPAWHRERILRQAGL